MVELIKVDTGEIKVTFYNSGKDAYRQMKQALWNFCSYSIPQEVFEKDECETKGFGWNATSAHLEDTSYSSSIRWLIVEVPEVKATAEEPTASADEPFYCLCALSYDANDRILDVEKDFGEFQTEEDAVSAFQTILGNPEEFADSDSKIKYWILQVEKQDMSTESVDIIIDAKIIL